MAAARRKPVTVQAAFIDRGDRVCCLSMRRSVMRMKMLGSFLIAVSLAGATVFADGPRTYQTTNMFQAGAPAIQKPGAATLIRSKQGVEMRVATSGLDAMTSYT